MDSYNVIENKMNSGLKVSPEDTTNFTIVSDQNDDKYEKVEIPENTKEHGLLKDGDSDFLVLDDQTVICSQPVTKFNNGKEYKQPNGKLALNTWIIHIKYSKS